MVYEDAFKGTHPRLKCMTRPFAKCTHFLGSRTYESEPISSWSSWESGSCTPSLSPFPQATLHKPSTARPFPPPLSLSITEARRSNPPLLWHKMFAWCAAVLICETFECGVWSVVFLWSTLHSQQKTHTILNKIMIVFILIFRVCTVFLFCCFTIYYEIMP